MSKENTRAIIDANIKQNGQQLITGPVLNATLKAMVTDYAEQGALNNLEEKVNALALGAFYGYFPDSSSLPTDVTTPGYAYVGEDNPYAIWNFNGEEWSDSGTSIDMNDADEEDITRNADGKLQFKNRDNTDGMGYIILRKDKTFAEQVTQTNTIYEIRYDFDLSDDFTMPLNCVLKFNGGKIGGEYELKGNNTKIDSPAIHVFSSVITLTGTWNVESAFPEWFGAKGDGETNDTDALQKVIDSFNTIVLNDKIYLSHQLNLSSNKTLIGNGATIKGDEDEYLIYGISLSNIKINGITFDGNSSCQYGIFLQDSSNIEFNDCELYGYVTINSTTSAMYLRRCHNVAILECRIHDVVGTPNGVIGDSIGASRAILLQSCHHVLVNDCIIYSIISTDDGDGFHAINETDNELGDIVISHCRISNCTRRLIKVQANGMTIQDCELYTDNETFSLDYGIAVYASFVKILNNRIYINTPLPISLGSSGVQSISKIDIRGNYIEHKQDVSQACIAFGSSTFSDIVICDNICDTTISSKLYAVYIRSSISNCVISNNVHRGGYGFVFVRFQSNGMTYKSITINGNVSETSACFVSISVSDESVISLDLMSVVGNYCSMPAPSYQGDAIMASPNDVKIRNSVVASGNSGFSKWNRNNKGYTSVRPSLLNNDNRGFIYYDYSLGKSIVWNGAGWTNMDGTAL